MNWDKVIAQNEIKNHLQDMVLQNRLSHALIFLGKEGSGALPLAIEFAKYIICQPKKAPIVEDLFGAMSAMPTTVSDEEQNAVMQRANQLIHADLHFSFPVITKKAGEKPTSDIFIKDFREFFLQFPYGNVYDWLQVIGAENKQGNITADECNAIIKKLSLKSFESDYKVLVLWMPEYLGKEGNKLLKLIEEPPPNTVFILVAESEENILPTILSRCQLVKVPLLSVADVEQALISRCNTDATKAHQIASISEGNYREALQLLQHNEEDWQSLLKTWLNCIVKKMLSEQLKWIEEISKLGREKQKQFLRYFNHIIEQSIRIKVIGAENVSLPESEKDFALRLNKIASVSKLQAIVKEIDDAIYYIERNANGKMLFQALSIKFHYIIQNEILVTVD